MMESSGSRPGSFISDQLESWHRKVQYEPWFIKLSTIDRRIFLGLGILIFVIIVIIAIASTTSGGGSEYDRSVFYDTDHRFYRGGLSTTHSGLQCVNWSQLNRTIHTVTVDRYPDHGLGDHNYCRNPDLSSNFWCYTSLDKNHFDYCSLPSNPRNVVKDESPDTDDVKEDSSLPNLDSSCDRNITVIVEGNVYVSGLYVLSTLWANGRGVYVRVQLTEDGDTRVKGDFCMSWHGQYRHWWIQSCSFIGNNGGIAWLEEDARCPYQGTTWRRGGHDELMDMTFATNTNCIQYGKEFNGTIVPGGMGDIQMMDTPVECQTECWRMRGCEGFTWYKENKKCKMFSKIEQLKYNSELDTYESNIIYNNKTVSGMSSCRQKVKVGCPDHHTRLGPDSCVKFLTDSSLCADGCSRFTAMEECEVSGGFLLDNIEPEDLKKLLTEIGSTSYRHNNWWTGASDFTKKGTGKFTWERSDRVLDDSLESVWLNTSTHDIAGVSAGDSHQCVYLGPVNNTQQIMLDHADCKDSIARPLCQYWAQ